MLRDGPSYVDDLHSCERVLRVARGTHEWEDVLAPQWWKLMHILYGNISASREGTYAASQLRA
eukprot:7268658-Alexandrium_andersonii.AAC.1